MLLVSVPAVPGRPARGRAGPAAGGRFRACSPVLGGSSQDPCRGCACTRAPGRVPGRGPGRTRPVSADLAPASPVGGGSRPCHAVGPAHAMANGQRRWRCRERRLLTQSVTPTSVGSPLTRLGCHRLRETLSTRGTGHQACLGPSHLSRDVSLCLMLSHAVSRDRRKPGPGRRAGSRGLRPPRAARRAAPRWTRPLAGWARGRSQKNKSLSALYS